MSVSEAPAPSAPSAPAASAPSTSAEAPASAPSSTPSESSGQGYSASGLPSYDWEAWTPGQDVPEPYRPGISRVEAYYKAQQEQAEKEIRQFMFGETDDNPYVPKSQVEKDLARLRELEDQSSVWTKEKEDLLAKISAAPDEAAIREAVRQEVMGEAFAYAKAEGERAAAAFATDYLDTLPPQEAARKADAVIEIMDLGVDAVVAFDVARLDDAGMQDFRELVEGGMDHAKALSRARKAATERSRKPSAAARLTSGSQPVSVLGNRSGEARQERQAPPGSARESLRRFVTTPT